MARVFNKTQEKSKRQSLRKVMPEAEVILWSKLKGKQLGGYKFRRQYSVGHYFLDFYCPARKLAIEIDGDSHFIGHAREKDKHRQEWIEQHGISFLRFTNDEIRKDLEEVLDEIERAMKEERSGRRK